MNNIQQIDETFCNRRQHRTLPPLWSYATAVAYDAIALCIAHLAAQGLTQ